MPRPPPLVPKNLRELLQNYPAHIERLRAAIEAAASDGGANAPRIEYIVWALEDTLESAALWRTNAQCVARRNDAHDQIDPNE